MVTQGPQMPPTAEFATKADLENGAHTLSGELNSEIEKSENRFIRALEASEKRINANISQSAEDTKRNIILEIEKARVTTLRWMVGATITLSAVMTGSVLAAIISLA